jgi:hypothetical protein
MISLAERAHIQEDLATLKRGYEEAADSGVRHVIREWILEAEQALAEEAKKDS